MAERKGPLDGELLRRFPVVRRFLVLRTASAVLGSAFTIAQALVIAHVLAALAGATPGSAINQGTVVLVACVLAGRVALAWWDRWFAELTVSAWKRQLRKETLTALLARGIRGGGPGAGSTATLLVKGVDTVDGYVTGTLSALPDVVVAPLTILGVLFVLDWPSALVVLVTLPVVPALLALVGLYTRARTEHQLTMLLRLGSQFLEAVSGLVTVRVLGRDKRTAQQVRKVADEHRDATVRTLRLAFLSSFVLETITSVAVALIAVPVGFRLLGGAMALVNGLAVLILVPEVYRPLRVLGAQFHTAQDAQTVLGEVRRTIADVPQRAVVRARTAAPDPSREPIELHGLTVGFASPVLTDVSMRLEPRRRYAVVGTSGAGKSTLLRTIAGVLPPLAGEIRIGGVDLREVDPDSWVRRIGMLPQRPHLFSGTVADNIRIGLPDAEPNQIWDALRRAGAADFVHRLPDGLDAQVGERAGRLSAGERQRLALARALVRDPLLLLLDEPTARLDGDTEQCVLDSLDHVAATVLVVAHRPRVIDRMDAVIQIAGGRAWLADEVTVC